MSESMFEAVDSRYDGPALEKEVLAFWESRAIFQQTVELSRGRAVQF